MRFVGGLRLAARAAAAALFMFSDHPQASLIGSNVNVGFYVAGDYIDANYGSTGTDPNARFLDPDGDPLRNLTIANGSSPDFFNTFFGTYMTLTFTPSGFTLTNLIPYPFPTANFFGVQLSRSTD